MKRLALLFVLVLSSCGDDDCCTGVVVDAARRDSDLLPDVPDMCAGQGRDKIKFTRAESCANDGSVEWCIPANDAVLEAALADISPTIHCAPGGGRARCSSPSGRLLCSYPTSYPDQCLSSHGEMKPEVWDDICQIAALPQVTEIVPTIFD